MYVYIYPYILTYALADVLNKSGLQDEGQQMTSMNYHRVLSAVQVVRLPAQGPPVSDPIRKTALCLLVIPVNDTKENVFGPKFPCLRLGSIPVPLPLETSLLISESLRKHAYSNILKILPPKNENFQIKNIYIFHISAQNIDCGYSLESPRRGGSNEYHNLCFEQK